MTNESPTPDPAPLTIEQWRTRFRSALDHLNGRSTAWTRLIWPGDLRVPEADSPAKDSPVRLILSGSFNPLHRGHQQMARLAAQHSGEPVWYELSIHNAEKNPLSDQQLWSRLISALPVQAADGVVVGSPKPTKSFWPHGLLLSTLPTYAEKAAAFPKATFALGVDTLVRVADPKFYEHSTKKRDDAIQRIAEHECRFLVFGRLDGKRFFALQDLSLPQALRDLCSEIGEGSFREDISSTEIRNRNTS